MPKKIYKPLIIYECPNCLKNFGNRKDYYLRHTDRKYPCKKTDIIFLQNPPDIIKINENIQVDANVQVDANIQVDENIQANNIEKNIEKNKNDFICEFCNCSFSKKYNLDRHKNGRCKVNNAKQEKNESTTDESSKDETVKKNLKMMLKQF